MGKSKIKYRESTMDEQKISAVWPGWKVVRKIGNGNYGCVYEVERNQFGTVEKAAVKVLTIPQDHSVIDEMYSDGYDDVSISKRMDDELEEMVKEYYLMLKLKGHTNVINCDDLQYKKHSDGLGYDVFIRMELLTPLHKITEKALNGQDAEEVALKLGKDICRALELCEKKDIVHRDIKPQNILLSDFSDYKLGDFGVAKTMEHTTSGTKTGTYKYMSPEVYYVRPYGHSADIYSLGLVLYWLLNEKRMPFLPLPPTVPTALMEEQAREKRFKGMPLPAPKNGSTALKMTVLKACAYKPENRFASAHEMLQALEMAENDKKVESLALDQNHPYVEIYDGTDRVDKISETASTMGENWNDTDESIGKKNTQKRSNTKKTMNEGIKGVDSDLPKKTNTRTAAAKKKPQPVKSDQKTKVDKINETASTMGENWNDTDESIGKKNTQKRGNTKNSMDEGTKKVDSDSPKKTNTGTAPAKKKQQPIEPDQKKETSTKSKEQDMILTKKDKVKFYVLTIWAVLGMPVLVYILDKTTIYEKDLDELAEIISVILLLAMILFLISAMLGGGCFSAICLGVGCIIAAVLAEEYVPVIGNKLLTLMKEVSYSGTWIFAIPAGIMLASIFIFRIKVLANIAGLVVGFQIGIYIILCAYFALPFEQSPGGAVYIVDILIYVGAFACMIFGVWAIWFMLKCTTCYTVETSKKHTNL